MARLENVVRLRNERGIYSIVDWGVLVDVQGQGYWEVVELVAP